MIVAHNSICPVRETTIDSCQKYAKHDKQKFCK